MDATENRLITLGSADSSNCCGGGACGYGGVDSASTAPVVASYSRADLQVLRVRYATTGEVLDFIGRYSDEQYTVLDAEENAPIHLRSERDQTTVVGLPRYSYLVHDPERGGVDFIQSASSLRNLGIRAERLSELFQEEDLASLWMR